MILKTMMTPCRNSSGSNISCEKKSLRYQMRIKTGIVLGINTGNSKLTFVFEIDWLFINYSWLMTYCQTGISQVGRKVKFGRVTNNDMRS